MKNIVLFDLDHTLIDQDSDYLWGEFLCKKQMVDVQEYQIKNNQFFQDYNNASLDIDQYLQFCLKPLGKLPKEQLFDLRDEFIQKWIKPLIYKRVLTKINNHRKQNDVLVIITSTNDFVAKPIADLFGIKNLIATQVEIVDGEFSGNYIKPACFQHNKVALFEQWIKNHNLDYDKIYAYSDSINDLPLLQLADYPFAVHPDEKLKKYALDWDWDICNWFE